tara:strand:- start:26 stop:637 length:612 start_codon:yes stop_codon:yes gene_type:complete
MSVEIKISKSPINYENAMEILEKRVNAVKNREASDLLWILEHPKTYTKGIRGSENDIIDKQIKVISTNRGGKITLHNPGQKIIYFVIDLNKRKRDIRKFVQFIEQSIIQFLKLYNIQGKTNKKNIGIWVKKKKIAAIGIRIKRWIAYHGCSININNNLKDYLRINPCGLKNQDVTSVANITRRKLVNIDEKIIKIFIENLKDI